MYKFFLICNNKNIQKNQTKQGGNQMKATGVVRRIDDLGRVVIPKEIREDLSHTRVKVLSMILRLSDAKLVRLVRNN